MSEPQFLGVKPEGISDQLKGLGRWVCWKSETRIKTDGTKYQTKVPYDPRTGERAKTDDPATWTTYEQAIGAYWAGGYAGVGLVVSDDDDIVGIDLDKCRDPETGELKTWAQTIVDTFDSYTSVSASGLGVRIFIRGVMQLSDGKSGIKNSKAGVEAYQARRFLTLTGHVIDGPSAVIEHRQAELDWLLSEYRTDTSTSETNEPTNPELAMEDNELLERAFAARNGDKVRRLFDGDWKDYGSQSEADLAFCGYLAFWHADAAQIDRIMKSSRLYRAKWERTSYRDRTIAKAMQGEKYSPPSKVKVSWPSSNGNDAGGGESTGADNDCGISLSDFASYLPDQKYIYLPTGKMWDPAGINRAFPSFDKNHKRSSEIDAANPIHDITWAPGHPQIIEDAFLDQGGWLPKAGARVYNHYRPPVAVGGDPRQVTRWLDLLEQVYPEYAEHIVMWFAHRVQRPAEKLNHAIVLGGTQGIGKDSLLEPVRHAVGAQNFGDVSPTMLTERFNAFLKNVVLRVSELRDLGDKDRYGFYEHTKTLIAAPPETVLVDEKNIRAYRVPNLVGVVFTTNHRTDGLYLPDDDRRHYVAWSESKPTDFGSSFWPRFYEWLDRGGRDHVAAYLQSVDLSRFDPKAPPLKTEAFWDIAAASRAPEDAPLSDAIDKLKNPKALTVADIIGVVRDDFNFRTWLEDRRNSRQLPHRFEAVGYVATRSPSTKDGRWVIGGKRQTVYAKQELSIHDRMEAATERAGQAWS